VNGRKKVQETRTQVAALRRATEDAFLISLRTVLDVICTMCLLAEQEDGAKRARHLQQAEKAFDVVLDVASRVKPDRQDRDAIEEARHNIRRLGGRDFSTSLEHATSNTALLGPATSANR